MVHFSPQEGLSDDYIMTLKVILNCIVSFMNERHRIMWYCAQNVVSLRVWYTFVNFNSTLVICLKFVFIEMLNKLITYIVCWYKTFIRSRLIRELTASLLVAIMTRSDTVSYNRLDLIQSLVPPHYVYNKYLFDGKCCNDLKWFIGTQFFTHFAFNLFGISLNAFDWIKLLQPLNRSFGANAWHAGNIICTVASKCQ